VPTERRGCGQEEAVPTGGCGWVPMSGWAEEEEEAVSRLANAVRAEGALALKPKAARVAGPLSDAARPLPLARPWTGGWLPRAEAAVGVAPAVVVAPVLVGVAVELSAAGAPVSDQAKEANEAVAVAARAKADPMVGCDASRLALEAGWRGGGDEGSRTPSTQIEIGTWSEPCT